MDNQKNPLCGNQETNHNHIRKAAQKDISRIAEILIFTKRMNYRAIFQNDQVSFGEMQVVPLAKSLAQDRHLLEKYWVYDDEFVKGLIHIEGQCIEELYVDSFFEGQGIGGRLIEFAVAESSASSLWVLEKNNRAISFYNSHGFSLTRERRLEEGTTEYLIRMTRSLNRKDINFL